MNKEKPLGPGVKSRALGLLEISGLSRTKKMGWLYPINGLFRGRDLSRPYKNYFFGITQFLI
jgi:hypothetical protein